MQLVVGFSVIAQCINSSFHVGERFTALESFSCLFIGTCITQVKIVWS